MTHCAQPSTYYFPLWRTFLFIMGHPSSTTTQVPGTVVYTAVPGHHDGTSGYGTVGYHTHSTHEHCTVDSARVQLLSSVGYAVPVAAATRPAPGAVRRRQRPEGEAAGLRSRLATSRAAGCRVCRVFFVTMETVSMSSLKSSGGDSFLSHRANRENSEWQTMRCAPLCRLPAL